MKTKQSNKTIVVLNGSPRPKGNTKVLVNLLNNELTKQKWQIKQFDLYKMHVAGCAHCDACKKFSDKPGCILKDDFTMALDEIVKADAIVIASPVYCWSLSGCANSALDRFYSLLIKGPKSEISLIKCKKIIGVMTSGGDHFDGMDLCVEMLKRLCDLGSSMYLGTLAAVNCTSPKELEQRVCLIKDAEKLAKSI